MIWPSSPPPLKSELNFALILLNLQEVASAASDAGVEDVAETMEDPIPNILQNASYFESGGVSVWGRG